MLQSLRFLEEELSRYYAYVDTITMLETDSEPIRDCSSAAFQ